MIPVTEIPKGGVTSTLLATDHGVIETITKNGELKYAFGVITNRKPQTVSVKQSDTVVWLLSGIEATTNQTTVPPVITASADEDPQPQPRQAGNILDAQKWQEEYYNNYKLDDPK